ncbi:MAG: T9SS type A sorting domain-containing protein, partial [candidate division KSB1 bacterium]|nr:T9SS type A sorting domain-containing protein [candidate division KSB1 bacterium]
YPNPFNPSTTISYSIPKTEKVTLEIYNTLGQKIVTLVDLVQPAGNYQVQVDGAKLTSGIYFYKLSTANFTQTRKMLLFK